MELSEIESKNAVEEDRLCDLRATIRRIRGIEASTLCHDCRRRRILAGLSLIRQKLGEQDRMSDENKGERGAAGGGADARYMAVADVSASAPHTTPHHNSSQPLNTCCEAICDFYCWAV